MTLTTTANGGSNLVGWGYCTGVGTVYGQRGKSSGTPEGGRILPIF